MIIAPLEVDFVALEERIMAWVVSELEAAGIEPTEEALKATMKSKMYIGGGEYQFILTTVQKSTSFHWRKENNGTTRTN